MKEAKRYLITSALPYANGPLHLGHICGAYLPADIYVRHLRRKGKDVVWVCGSDEHGAAITLRAKKEGKSPQEIVDTYHTIIKKAFGDLGISFDIYHRTSSPLHHETAQEFFTVLNDNGQFKEKESEQYFDEEHQQFLADRYIYGTCPKCSYEKAFGDQCENCGSNWSPFDLIDPRSTLSDKPPVKRSTKHWYLPMDKHEEWISEWISKGVLNGKEHHDPKEWKKHVVGQCRSWIDAGLHARAMTRDLDWGVKVPIEGTDGKVLYVWLDAPIGYISATKEWAKQNGKNWEDYWKSEDTHLLHFIGKDNIVFHCIIFPILLKAHGEFSLPYNVPANEFLNLEGDKFSTSRNWAVWLHEYLEDFPTRVDELRYVLGSILPESKDSEFTWSDYQARVNNELVAILGNFVNRAVVLTHKYYKGSVPVSSSVDQTLIGQVDDLIEKSENNIEQFRFREALAEAMNIARVGNKYLAEEEPWKLIKTDEEKTKKVINTALVIALKAAHALEPFLPNSSKKIKDILNFNGSDLEFSKGHVLNKAEILYQKVEDEEMEQQREKLKSEQMKEKIEVEARKANITFDDFQKLDIRTGKIITAEKMENADKLLKLSVDLGSETRTIVSGIAEHYSIDELAGKTVSVMANLTPKKLRGVESRGMILMAENEAGDLAFVVPEKTMDPGTEIR